MRHKKNRNNEAQYTGGEWEAVKASSQMCFPETTVCVINYDVNNIEKWFVSTTAHKHGSEEHTAKLIAAAPDMLKALKAAIKLSDKELKPYHGGRSEECQKIYNMVKAAIKKATE